MYILIEIIDENTNIYFYNTLQEAQQAMHQLFNDVGLAKKENITSLTAFKNKAQNYKNYDWLILKCYDET